MEYRRDIDGLRALALIPVILFHAGFTSFSGGFVGVDVFFVISGYLITSIILADQTAGTFSLLHFYERRARRILPALLFVILCTIPFAWLYLKPTLYKEYSESLVAVSLFSSNILFWIQSGYFETVSELKPFLHTWSLAIEEQYYVLFPLFLILAWRLGKKWIAGILVATTIISLYAAYWGSQRYPSLTFYLLPFRAWEILIGALVSLYINYKPANRASFSQLASEIFSALGLVLILYAIFAFDKQTPFPSFYTLIPTLGAGLIILFSSNKVLVGKILGNKLLVGIGLISYSAYLWHQPILVFARVLDTENLTRYQFLGLSVLSIIFGYISWKYIEKPARNKNFQIKKLAKLGLFSFAVLISLGLYGYKKNGLASRFPQEARLYFEFIDFNDWYPLVRKDQCHLQDINIIKHASLCHETKRPLVALWGDSHASALYPGLKKLQDKNNFGITQLTETGCPPLHEVSGLVSSHCNEINKQNLIELKVDKPDILIIHSAWELPREYPFTRAQLKSKLTQFLDETKAALPNTRIILIGPMPRWKVSPQDTSANYWMANQSSFVPNRLKAIQFNETDEILRNLSTTEKVEYISALKELCNEDGCIARLGNKVEDFIQIDAGHVSKVGSEYFIDKIKNKIGIL